MTDLEWTALAAGLVGGIVGAVLVSALQPIFERWLETVLPRASSALKPEHIEDSRWGLEVKRGGDLSVPDYIARQTRLTWDEQRDLLTAAYGLMDATGCQLGDVVIVDLPDHLRLD